MLLIFILSDWFPPSFLAWSLWSQVVNCSKSFWHYIWVTWQLWQREKILPIFHSIELFGGNFFCITAPRQGYNDSIGIPQRQHLICAFIVTSKADTRFLKWFIAVFKILDSLRHSPSTVHSPLFFRKIIEIKHFALRTAILDECQNYLPVGAVTT